MLLLKMTRQMTSPAANVAKDIEKGEANDISNTASSQKARGDRFKLGRAN